MTEPARTRFGSYEVLHELKSGGMGSVLIARRRGPGAFEQLVAIKTIRVEHAASPTVRAMFLDEAAILARINHPGIATVHDFGEQDGALYMVMEYVAGLPFRDIVEHKPPPAILARAVADAARGLHAAHELRDLDGTPQGVVHRDISPDNLMLGFDGHVKVIDFGIALIKKRQAPATEFGTLKGKPPYMSPEQVKNEGIDRRSDVFSLGVVLWELLTQRALFEGDSIYAIAFAVQEQTIVPPSHYAGALPQGLDEAVMSALARDPAKRTPTAAAFAEQLEQVAHAAGGASSSESIEAWSARELAGARDRHRAWLASIASGGKPVESPRAGRATGQQTEVAPLAVAKTDPAPQETSKSESESGSRPESVESRSQSATDSRTRSIIESDEDESPARRSRAPIVIAGVALLATGAAALLATSSRTQRSAGVRDAAVIADSALTSDSSVVDVMASELPVDAALAIDAGQGRTRDAGVVAARDGGVAARADASPSSRPDAGRTDAPVTARPDAAVQPTGTGLVTIRYKPGVYANISIDGGVPKPGPFVRYKLPAGPHTIRFHHPTSSEVLDTQTITVEDGKLLDVLQR